jgi:hypothetical protein
VDAPGDHDHGAGVVEGGMPRKLQRCPDVGGTVGRAVAGRAHGAGDDERLRAAEREIEQVARLGQDVRPHDRHRAAHVGLGQERP